MKTPVKVSPDFLKEDDFLEVLERIREVTPMPFGTLPVSGQRHYQAVLYTYLESLQA